MPRVDPFDLEGDDASPAELLQPFVLAVNRSPATVGSFRRRSSSVSGTLNGSGTASGPKNVFRVT